LKKSAERRFACAAGYGSNKSPHGFYSQEKTGPRKNRAKKKPGQKTTGPRKNPAKKTGPGQLQ